MMKTSHTAWNNHLPGRAMLLLFAAPLMAAVTAAAAPQAPAAPQSPVAAGPVLPQPATAETTASDSEWSRWASGRYRITPGDVLELRFPFVPELDQTLAVQPDGYVTLREVGDMRVQGRTVIQLRADLLEAYTPFVREPVFTVVLKEFEKPYFVAAGEVMRPGRYDLRGATTLTQALAYAGGPTGKAKVSDVVIFRYHTEDSVSVRRINVKEMYAKNDLSEDPLLRPGDTVYISKSTIGKLSPLLSRLGLSMFLNPLDLVR